LTQGGVPIKGTGAWNGTTAQTMTGLNPLYLGDSTGSAVAKLINPETPFTIGGSNGGAQRRRRNPRKQPGLQHIERRGGRKPDYHRQQHEPRDDGVRRPEYPQRRFIRAASSPTMRRWPA